MAEEERKARLRNTQSPGYCSHFGGAMGSDLDVPVKEVMGPFGHGSEADRGASCTNAWLLGPTRGVLVRQALRLEGADLALTCEFTATRGQAFFVDFVVLPQTPQGA